MNTNNTNNPPRSGGPILITGGCGFVGSALLRELARPDAVLSPSEIRLFDPRPPSNEVMALGLPLTHIQGTLAQRQLLNQATNGVETVFHLASMVDWGTHRPQDVMAVNVTGTEQVVTACRQGGVRSLVHTSSLDAIFSGRPIVDADESVPPPEKGVSTYGRSKALAEKVVRGANDGTLKTVSLRPAGIFGEGDPYHLGRLVKMARQGFFVKIGHPQVRCMHVYVGNVAHAHLMAAKALLDGNEIPSGQVYFVLDGEPENFFDTLVPILEAAGLRVRPQNLWLPGWSLYPAALASELTARLLRPLGTVHPGLSRFALSYLCNDFIIKTDRARADFGYTPRYRRSEAVSRTAAWLKLTL